ncbi:MAG: Transcription factor Sox-2 [Watsoniomyces obsoletus]|nr:MAG: Transcription factor Sox-2 [Watsoniomyces obsoletus]
MAASIPNWKGLSPRLLSAGECWHPRPPTEAEMWKASVTEIQRAKVDEDVPYQVYDSLEQPSSDVAGNVATSLMQIRMRRKEDEDEGQWSELQRNPVTVLNLFPSYLAQRVHIPLRLKQHLEFEDPPPKAANITPKYAFVDVHIDHGMEAISICVGRCRKVWFLWPPTTDNLKEMERLDHRDPDRLIRSYLDDGILLQTDKSTGIHVPSGWLHATFTIEGGFLVGITPVTAESIGLISSCTSSELVSEPGTQPNLKGYIRGLETALRSTKPSVLQDTLDGWQHLGPQLAILRTGKKGLGDNGKALRAIWDEFLLRFSLKLQRRRSEDQVMVLTSESCCNLTDPAFPDHFRAVHMVPVFSHSRSRV